MRSSDEFCTAKEDYISLDFGNTMMTYKRGSDQWTAAMAHVAFVCSTVVSIIIVLLSCFFFEGCLHGSNKTSLAVVN